MTPPMSTVPAASGLSPLLMVKLGVTSLKCLYKPLKMFGIAALWMLMVKPETAQVSA